MAVTKADVITDQWLQDTLLVYFFTHIDTLKQNGPRGK
jgi:hypothetical protein